MTSGALARVIRTAAERGGPAPDTERCDLCGAPVPADHRHLLDTGTDGGTQDPPAGGPGAGARTGGVTGGGTGEAGPAGGHMLCACRPCSVLFAREAASEGHYRLIPQRRTRLEPVPTAPLGVPVGLAFFVPHADGGVHAHYPSPAGPTQWELDPEAWQGAVRECPALATLAADVEALLVNTVQGRRQHWIVPVDDCFRMVAVVRREWRGLTGGSRVWPEIDRFFAELTEQSG
ncbi:DUF5947 family protein [Streptomyces reniochalinae]|uniref:Uncharacterized protein n=1 Tax=Streptomyces reniochalinae TaxID=2250578 RepID=A0A367EB37_9ACTN|nr:DUF5947 family protein [Streptomyces reniochalinae]RCG15274.1 hypothetical protein DQ392_24075 [Streptomyces reniochalinae]